MSERINIEEYLERYSPQMRELAEKLRDTILEMFPDMDEVIKWNNLVYKNNRYICAILIHNAHINLEFWLGTELKDPEKRLDGTGKRMRHLKISDESEIDTEYIRILIEESIELNDANLKN